MTHLKEGDLRMTPRIFALLALLLLIPSFTPPLGAGGVEAAVLPAPKETGNCFMWEIEGKDGGGKAWILGSLHFGKPEMYPLDAAIEEAWQSAGILVVEADMNNPEVSRKSLSLMMEKGVYRNGGSLPESLGPERTAKLDAFLKTMNSSVENMRLVRPWQVSLALSIRFVMKNGWDIKLGLESILACRALKEGLKVTPLETPERHVEAFAGASDEAQMKNIMEIVESPGNCTAELDFMMKYWIAGDAGALDSILKEMERRNPEYIEHILHERSLEMAAKIKDMLSEDNPPFVLIGAGHLVGERGVIELLRKEGFKVRQVGKKGAPPKDGGQQGQLPPR